MYNARKRGEDRASDYFKRTENVAGVKDMRFQALMPDILHWLGITKIDRMLSMSKYVCPYPSPAFPRREVPRPCCPRSVLPHYYIDRISPAEGGRGRISSMGGLLSQRTWHKANNDLRLAA